MPGDIPRKLCMKLPGEGQSWGGASLPPGTACAHKMCQAPAKLPQGTARGWGPAWLSLGSGPVLPAGTGCPDTSGCARGSGHYLLEGAWERTVHFGEAFSIPELPAGQVCVLGR